jgi:hypothetical protein
LGCFAEVQSATSLRSNPNRNLAIWTCPSVLCFTHVFLLLRLAYPRMRDLEGGLHMAVRAFQAPFVAVAETGEGGAWHPVVEELPLAVGANEL